MSLQFLLLLTLFRWCKNPHTRLCVCNFVAAQLRQYALYDDYISELICISFFFLSYYRYRQTRFSSRRVRKRVIFKHGDVNVVQGNVAKRRRRYLQVNFTYENFIIFRVHTNINSISGYFYYPRGHSVALDNTSVCIEFYPLMAVFGCCVVSNRIRTWWYWTNEFTRG